MNPSKELRHSFLATHSDGSLEYWHATSRQLLFSRKVFSYRNSIAKCSRLAKSVPWERTMPSLASWAEFTAVCSTRERRNSSRLDIWGIMTIEFSALNGSRMIITCWLQGGGIEPCISGTSVQRPQSTSYSGTISGERQSTSRMRRWFWGTTSRSIS